MFSFLVTKNERNVTLVEEEVDVGCQEQAVVTVKALMICGAWGLRALLIAKQNQHS